MIRHFCAAIFAYFLIIGPATSEDEIPGLISKKLIREGMPENPAAYQETDKGFIYYSSTRFLNWENEKHLLVSKNVQGKSQLHILKAPLEDPQQITYFDKKGVGSARPAQMHGEAGYIIGRDNNGDEYYQYYFLNRLSRKIIHITDTAYRYGSSRISPDQTKVIFSRSLGTSGQKSITILDMTRKGATEEILFETPDTFRPLQWSPDGKSILLSHYVSTEESYLALLDVETRKLNYLSPRDQKWVFKGARFSRDGTGVYLISNMGSDVANLRYMDLKTRKIYYLASEIKWPIDDIELSPDGKMLAITSNSHGLHNLFLLNTETQKLQSSQGHPVGIVANMTFSPDSSKIAMNVSHPLFPRDIFIYSLKYKKITRWTEGRSKSTKNVKLTAPNLVFYPSFDDLKIPAFIYRPLKENRKYDKSPVIITLHGGPASQHNPYLSVPLQYYVNRMGITIIAPNVRGSSGYGDHYVSLDNGFKREDSVRDVGALLDWIKNQPDLDKDRVMVMGGSYGGYMVLASLMHYGDRLKAGIDRVGISNFTTFLENTSEYRVDLRRKEYGDERDPDMRAFHARISPLNNAHKITKPLFVVQGLNDPRVPASEARQIVDAVRKNNVPVWYLLAKNEGHGFKKSKNTEFLRRATISFIRKYLLDDDIP